MAIAYGNHLSPLRDAFSRGNMALYIGAGVSKSNGLPGWEELVQALYFTTLEDESFIYELRPFPNYLFALAEWVLKQKNEPLDIIIRKIKQWYEGKDFIDMLSNTLYAGFERGQHKIDIGYISQLVLEQNRTLQSIVDCCRLSRPGSTGLRSIVTYNYDNLLELGLEQYPEVKDNFISIYKGDQKLKPGIIPIYHVHGYIPYQNSDVKYEDILFSEEQYNRAFQDPFYWGNVVQVNQFTSVTGLMIGLSLSDRNTRRILDSIRNQPIMNNNYILMRKPVFKNIENDLVELDQIRRKAFEYQSRYHDSRMKMPGKEAGQIQNILDKIYIYESQEFEKGFENLGLNLITFEEFDEIPEILNAISSTN
jgi:hypothetical protein